MAKPKRQHQANASYWQTETNWMQLVLFGMQSRTARDGHLAAKQGIKFPGMGGTPKWREDAHGKTQTAHDKTQTGDQIPGDGWRTQTARGRPWQNPNSPWQNPDRGSNARGWVAHPNGERTPMAALARLVVAQTSCSPPPPPVTSGSPGAAGLHAAQHGCNMERQICFRSRHQTPNPNIFKTNRIHLVLLGIRIGHLVPIWQPITGSSFHLCNLVPVCQTLLRTSFQRCSLPHPWGS
jgi:hypothetical protein